MNIIEMNLQASLLILVILIIRALGIHTLPRWSFQALWGIALVRLLVPFRVEFPLSLYNLFRQKDAYGPALTHRLSLPSALLPDTVIPPAPAAQTSVAASAASPVSFSPWIALWLSVAFILAIYFLSTHLYWRGAYGKARLLYMARVGRSIWSRAYAIQISSRIDAPLTYGILHPVILMPEGLLGHRGYDFALAHELAHVRHWDALKKWLFALALCVNWFNPLVIVMYILAGRDMELSCDESALRALGPSQKTRYAEMLIDLEEARGFAAPLVSHFSKNAIEERILAMMNYKKTSLLGIILSVILVIFSASALATSAVSASAPISASTAATEVSNVDPTETAKQFAPYAAFGLSYDMENDKLYYNGQPVRYFEDFYEVEEGNYSGMMCTFSDSGEIDVHAVRDPEKRVYNADGSFDPAGELTGVALFSQEEFDARTKKLQEANDTDNHAAASATAVGSDMIEWWTASEYEAWLDNEREALPKLIGSKGWTGSEGWFVWDQARVDKAIALYEGILENIRKGAQVSKTINGRDDIVISTNPGEVTVGKTDTAENVHEFSIYSSGDVSLSSENADIVEDQAVSTTVTFTNQADSAVSEGTASSGDAASIAEGAAYAETPATSTSSFTVSAVEIPAEATSITVVDANNDIAQGIVAAFSLPDGKSVNMGPYDTYLARYEAVKDFCDGLVEDGTLTQEQADAISAIYR